MLSKIFRSNSCIRFPESTTFVYKQKSDKTLQGIENFCRKYDEKRYIFLNDKNDIILESHPQISIAFDKCLKKKLL